MPPVSEDSLRNEYNALQVMHGLGIGPKPLGLDLARSKIEMELVDGRTVQDLLGKQNKDTSDADKTAMLYKAVDVAVKLHEAGYSHNDLHEGNVMIDGTGNAKLIDGGMVTKVGSGLAYGREVSNGFKDLSRLIKPLSHIPAAEKLYDDLLDDLDSSGALSKFKQMRDIKDLMGDDFSDEFDDFDGMNKDVAAKVAKRRNDSELYLHGEYLKSIRKIRAK
jgi:tRNA A-37 threonylcarbamoyl transferase component Bud32